MPTNSKLPQFKRLTPRNYLLLGLFVVSLFLTLYLFYNLPAFTPEDREQLRLPRNLDDVKDVANILSKYQEENNTSVALGFCVLYIFLQTFAIPGTLLLSILSGALFDSYLALFFVTFCSSTGASLCYGLSNYLAFNLVNRTFPKQLESFRLRIQSQKSNIFFYLLFLRLTPLLPNWFINLACPIIDIKFIYFLFATMFGLIPANWIYVNMGQTVTKISNDSLESGMIMLDMNTMIALFGLAIMSLIPIVIKNYFVTSKANKKNDNDIASQNSTKKNNKKED